MALVVRPILPEIEKFLGLVRENEWALISTQADDLHEIGLDGSGVIICVVDTGVDLSHSDLQGANVIGWKDFVKDRQEPYDDHPDGHGTAMLGLIAGQGRVFGFAPGASLIVIKAITRTGEGVSSVVVRAISLCMDPFGNGTRSHIISLSLGGSPRPMQRDEVAEEAAEAASRGIFVVAAAGNEDHEASDVQSPASEEMVIGVGAVSESLQIAPFSQRGSNEERTDPHKKPELVAPGVELVTTGRESTYLIVAGTSAAAAVVSALLALVLQGAPCLKAGGSAVPVIQLKMTLMETARKAEGQDSPHDDLYGYGLIQALATLDALRG